MRIAKNGDVHVSVPIGLPKREVEAFIQKHQEWIVQATKKTLERQQRRADFYGRLPLATKAERLEAVMRLKALVEPMIERHARVMNVCPEVVSYKRMVSRWGVCKVKERSISFSLYLLLLPDWCVEHVVVHELCHLLEPSHNARFHALMDHYYPQWREARKETLRMVKTGGSPQCRT